MSIQPSARSPDPFALKRPCGNCPFRTDPVPFLDQERAKDIADSLAADASFHCHKTVDYGSEDGTWEITPESKHCAGALIVLEHKENPNQMMRIAWSWTPPSRKPWTPGWRCTLLMLTAGGVWRVVPTGMGNR